MAALLLAAASGSAIVADPGAPVTVERQYQADEADQGVASDGTHFYAIDNNRIGKYRIADGEKVAEWQGDPEKFPHINSCTVVAAELVCAASNYPAVPQSSSVEVFSLEPLAHVRSIALDKTPGSLTVMDRHDGHWWAVFANYDERGSPQGQDHHDTYLVRYSDTFQEDGRWSFPAAVLDRFAPSSCSGASWSDRNVLLVSGHDKPEIYKMALPEQGTELVHVATLPVSTHGQAIDLDPSRSDSLWSIDRKTRTVVVNKIDSND